MKYGEPVTFGGSFKRAVSQPAFLVVAGILLVCAVGLNAATQYMKLSFKKEAVPLARPLADLPERMGPWMQVSMDETLTHDFQEALGTDKYVFRDYIDTRLVGPDIIAKFKDKTPLERKQLAFELQMAKPGSVINLGLTYYTGLVDTVAHVPDRCYIADGYEPSHYDIVNWNSLASLDGDHQLRYIVFEDSTPGRQSVAKNVAYFFNCNGQYLNDPIGVRRRLADLSQKYGYYMKIEIQTIKLAPDAGARVMDDFLSSALPHVARLLPDWSALDSSKASKPAAMSASGDVSKKS